MTTSLERRLARDLHRVADTTDIPALPAIDPSNRKRGRPRRRNALIAAAAVTAAVAVGAPVTAAAGGLSAIKAAFGWTHQPPPRGALPVIRANDATGRYVLTVPGPPGVSWQIWVAAADGGGRCVSLLEPVPGGYKSFGSGCSAAGSVPTSLGFGGGGGDTSGWITNIDAPDAAYVTLADGLTTRRVAVADGVSAAWLPPIDQGRSITLTAYNGAGAIIGTTSETVYMIPPAPAVRPNCGTDKHGTPLACPPTNSTDDVPHTSPPT